MLTSLPIIGFIPIKDAEKARRFYVDTLGLEFIADDGFALVLRANGTMIRLVRTGSDFKPVPYTILGWEVEDMAATIQTLTKAGVHFEKYSWFEQDPVGIWTSPNGNQVAWFKDPDGNVLSLSKH
jgi:catechol 2,3-dioxygenase-like lactoylglutathione lyase family enzyme